MPRTYDVVYLVSDNGLTKEDVSSMADRLSQKEFVPVRAEAVFNAADAIGFMTMDAFDKLDHDKDMALEAFISKHYLDGPDRSGTTISTSAYGYDILLIYK